MIITLNQEQTAALFSALQKEYHAMVLICGKLLFICQYCLTQVHMEVLPTRPTST
jgi:hypothetical protein